MKDYLSGFFVLGLVLAVAFFFAFNYKHRVAEARLALDDAVASESRKQTEYDLKSKVHEGLWAGSSVYSDFLDKWRPHVTPEVPVTVALLSADFTNIAGSLTAGAAQGLSCDVASSARVLDYPLSGEVVKGQSFSVRLRGAYGFAVAWLGAVEERYPLIKVDGVTITAQAGVVSMVVRAIYPEFSLIPKPVPLSAK